jgi:hypothetical protein
MGAGVNVEIDQLSGFAHAANGGFLNGFAVSDQGDDAAVVVGVHFAVEQVDAGHFHGVDDGVNFGFVAAFGEIGYAFDERGHNGRGYSLTEQGSKAMAAMFWETKRLERVSSVTFAHQNNWIELVRQGTEVRSKLWHSK